MRRIVIDLRDRRPIWALPEALAAEFAASLPEGWEMVQVSSWADGSGDGAGGVSEEVLDAVRGAEVYIGYGIPEAVLEAGRDSLRWVHTGTAGVGSSLHDAMRRSGVLFTNSAGTHGPPIAESVVGMLLHFARGFDLAVRGQAEGRWVSRPFFQTDAPVRELSRMHVVVLGYGGIGREVGRWLTALGTRVTGVRRGGGPVRGGGGTEPEERADPGNASPVRIVHGAAGLDRVLGSADALVVSAPATPETRGIVSRERIRALPRGAVIVNVARGSLIDQGALVEALADGHLRGAGLDVFDPEPLPPGHPLWGLPNVLLTPHVSGVTHAFWDRELPLIRENFRRYLAGEAMVNPVDLDAGY